MRLLFAGTPAAAVPSLQALISRTQHEVVAVLTRPDAPAGRGRRTVPSPVAELAAEAGIETLRPPRPSDEGFLTRLAELEIDCAAVVAYGALLREPALSLPRLGWVNLHFSLLPAWRGAAPVQHALLHGDDVTGASTFQIGPGLDDGPVFGLVTETIGARDTSGTLLARLADSGARLLAATMDGIADGSLRPQPQPLDGVSLAPKLDVQDGYLDFSQPALALDRRARACTPAPGPWTTFRGERLKLAPPLLEVMSDAGSAAGAGASGADGADGAGPLGPGELRLAKNVLWVGTATAPLRLTELQPPGKRLMPAADWARGVRLTEADRLGDQPAGENADGQPVGAP